MHGGFAGVPTIQASSGMSGCPCWGVVGLISDFNRSMIFENEGRFQGSLAQQSSIMAATWGFKSRGISSLFPLKPTAATTYEAVSHSLVIVRNLPPEGYLRVIISSILQWTSYCFQRHKTWHSGIKISKSTSFSLHSSMPSIVHTLQHHSWC